MTQAHENSIIRIISAGIPVGTGFLVSSTRALTCAHVVATALQQPLTADIPSAEITFDLPLLAAGQTRTARVVAWNIELDLAALEIIGKVPHEVQPARLIQSVDLWKHDFRAFGFPMNFPNGVWASGRILGREASGWNQIEDTKQTGYFIQPGFSGGAIWDETLGGVVGMVVAADTREDVRSAFVIPVSRIAETFPELQLPINVFQPVDSGAPIEGEPPYMGMRYFDTSDADLFYGREALTRELLARVQKESFLAIVGASGSGKSSVARAGLIPAWTKKNERGVIHVITPTAHPLESLAASLTRKSESVTATSTLMDDLKNDSRSLRLYVKKSLGETKSLLLVDQFEETFTLCKDADERKAFIENLLSLADDGSSARVVITLRADFYAHCAEYEGLRLALDKHQKYIGAMTPDELRQAITAPAQSAGWDFQPGLVDLILQDVGTEPGALPLLSHALLETWRRRQGHTLTLKGYADAGGVKKAITQTAESVYDKLTPAEQTIARGIFLRLTELGEGVQDTRRRVKLDELSQRTGTQDSVAKVLKTLTDARLVTTEQDSAEVAHEALIREWGTLRKWLDEDRDSLRLHRHLTESAQEWERSGRDEALLNHRGGRLELALVMSKNPKYRLSLAEQAYLDTCMRVREREVKAKETLRRRIMTGLATGLVIALILAGFAVYQMSQAEQQAKIARSRELATYAGAVVEKNPSRSLLLAQESLNLAGSVPALRPVWSEQALRDSLLQTGGHPLSGHTSSIMALAFSPDGKWLATGSMDHTARLWDMQNPSVAPIILRGHESRIDTLAFSPDGKWLATGSEDQTARLWDMQNPAADPISLRGHTDWVITLAFSPNGKWLATGSWDSTIRLWDMQNLSAEPIILHESNIGTLAFSPDGKWLAMGSDDQTARLWDMQNLAAAPIILRGHEDWTSPSLVFSPDGRWLATGSIAAACLWDMQNPAADPIILRGHKSRIGTLAFSPDGKWLATGSEDQTARLWDMQNPAAESIVLLGHTSSIMTLAFSPDGKWLATGSEDRTARLWNMQNPATDSIILRGHEDAISTLAFNTDGKWLATGSMDGTARLWNMQDLSAAPIVLHTSGIMTLAFSPDGKWLATGGIDNTALLWDVQNPSTKPTVLRGHESFIRILAFSPDGKWLATGSRDTTIRLWDMQNPFAVPIVLRGHEASIGTLAFSPDGKWLATGCGYIAPYTRDNTARLWDMKNLSNNPIILHGQVVDGVVGDIGTAAFSPNGKWLATGGYQTAHLWNMQNPSADPIVLHGYRGWISILAFSSDGKWLASNSQDRTIQLWDMQNPAAAPIALHGHEDYIGALAFSPDGKRLATGSRDTTIRLWDMQNPSAEPIILRGHEGNIGTLAFSPDGKWLATGSDDNTARLWLMSLDDLVTMACQYVGRNFWQWEWNQYFPDEAYRATCPQWP